MAITPAPQPNSYGFAILAVVGGVALTTAYTFASIFIPLFAFGVVLPLAVAVFLIVVLLAGLRGALVFRVIVVSTGTVLNLVTLWFAAFWAHWGWDEAVYTLSRGPGYVWDTIVHLSDTMSFQFGDPKDVLRNSGFTVQGAGLLILWAIEALIFVGAGIAGLVLAGQRQERVAGDGLRGDAMRLRDGIPIAKGLAIGTIKNLLQVALVFGAIWLIVTWL